MTTNSSGPIRFLNAPGRRRAALTAVVALLTATAVEGCSSSSGGGAIDEFAGTWSVDLDPTTSHFTLSCPFLDDSLEFPLWSTVRLEEGTLSDLVELGGPCPTYYDIAGKMATLVSPDPFTKAAPFCRIDESTDTVTAYLEFQFTSWKINLLAPVKGEAPKGQMIGSAGVPLITIDGNGDPQPDPGGDCTYVVNARITKIGK